MRKYMYRYFLAVYDDRTKKPCFYIASESNDTEFSPDDGHFFLVLVTDNMRSNLGSSKDWGNRDKFEIEALKIVEERLSSTISNTAPTEFAGKTGKNKGFWSRLFKT